MKVVVVGSGIVGLATARLLAQRGDEVVVLEKEATIASHQTGRNSGVIHAGLYYAPGSLKARMAVAGSVSMKAFAQERGVAYATTGKLVVATEEAELPALDVLTKRAAANGVAAHRVSPAEAREVEPYVRCVAALRVEPTGIIDYAQVCRVLADDIRAAGGQVRTSTAFRRAVTVGDVVRVETDGGDSGDRSDRGDGGDGGDSGPGGTAGPADLEADVLVACAGLYADRVAQQSGITPQARIVPFRGEYFELVPQLDHLVRGLIYPVPDPRFPFLGVHLTRMVHGGIHAGPNAVLALRREGYTWHDLDLGELRESLAWPGLWQLARRNLVPGSREVVRSLSKAAFARSLSRLVPGIGADDLLPAPAGVRAQALRRDGSMVDDFLVQTVPRQVHVLNAPSPAATAALEIAAYLVGQVDAAV